MLKRAFLFALCSFTMAAYGQTRHPLTQFSRLPVLYNPAASGVENLTEMKIGARYQWTAAEESPKGHFLGINHSFQKEEASITKVGMAGFVVQENAGAFRDLQAGIAAAVHVPVSQKYFLSLGINVDYNRISVDQENLRVRDMEDRQYQDLMASDGSVSSMDITPGLMLHSDKFYIGYAPLRLVRTPLGAVESLDEKANVRHTAMLGYVYDLNEEWELSPGLLVQMEDGLDPSYNFLAKVRYQSKFWAGAGYSLDNSASVLIGFSPGTRFNVSYSYDASLGEASNFNYGNSHEIIIGIPFNNENGSSFLWN